VLTSNWLGGKSFEPYDIKFNNELRQMVRKRDKNKCQVCKKRKYGSELPVHHVDYNKKNSIESNLIALCLSCHMKINHNRQHWTLFFRDMLEKRGLGEYIFV